MRQTIWRESAFLSNLHLTVFPNLYRFSDVELLKIKALLSRQRRERLLTLATHRRVEGDLRFLSR
jgi:hypothetical protein